MRVRVRVERGDFYTQPKVSEERKAWPAGVSLPGQRAQRKGVAIGAEGMAGCSVYSAHQFSSAPWARLYGSGCQFQLVRRLCPLLQCEYDLLVRGQRAHSWRRTPRRLILNVEQLIIERLNMPGSCTVSRISACSATQSKIAGQGSS